MSLLKFCLTFCACLVGVSGTLCSQAVAAETTAKTKPNVLFIAIDDLNDWVGYLKGHPQVQTPNIDRLAKMGTAFTNAHCQSPLCNPSRTSLMTGLRPSTTGVYGLAPWFRTLPEFAERTTLTEHFRNNGYQVLSTGKIFHGSYPGRGEVRKREFDQEGPRSQVGAKPKQKIIPPTPNGNHPLMDWGTFDHTDEQKGDYQCASWAVERMGELKQTEQPFFLACGFFLPHVPCYASPQWFELYPEETLQLPPTLLNDRSDTPEFSWYIHWSLPEPRLNWVRENQQWKPLVRAYLACISFVDSQVGRLLDAAEQNGHLEDTIIVLWSDHGFHLGEKEITGKNTLWDAGTRVPLIFAGPGVTKNAECSEPVELLDIYPSLIELCDLTEVDGLEGHSLQPQLMDASAARQWPAITTHNKGNHGVRTKRYRYIHYYDGSEEFYDLQADPHEFENAINKPEFAEIVEQHRKWLPQVDRPAAPGSKHRVLEYDETEVIWEGRTIDNSWRMK